MHLGNRFKIEHYTDEVVPFRLEPLDRLVDIDLALFDDEFLDGGFGSGWYRR